jgi:hypothetical protein
MHDPGPVRIAYLVVSHRNPDQVLRLVRVLGEGPAAQVVVRHDQGGSRLPAAEIERAGALALEVDAGFEWGRWSQLQAMLRLLELTAEAVDPDWLLVLSGQDYPLRPLAEIEAGLASSGFDALLGDARQLEIAGLPEPPQDEFFLRYAYRHYALPRATPRVPGRLRRLAYLRECPPPLPPLLGLRRLKTPFRDGFGCFVSSDWLTLRRPALEALLRAAREQPALVRYYRRTWIPTESFYASVLLNDPSLRVADRNRRFLSFQGPLTPHPDTLTSTDLDRLLASDCDFARKFDSELDAAVLDALDERRHSPSPR